MYWKPVIWDALLILVASPSDGSWVPGSWVMWDGGYHVTFQNLVHSSWVLWDGGYHVTFHNLVPGSWVMWDAGYHVTFHCNVFVRWIGFLSRGAQELELDQTWSNSSSAMNRNYNYPIDLKPTIKEPSSKWQSGNTQMWGLSFEFLWRIRTGTFVAI